MTGHDKKHFTPEQIEKILFDRKVIKMTYQDLVNKYGGSLSGMQKICARGK